MRKKNLPLCVSKSVDAIDNEATGAKFREMRIRYRFTQTEVGQRIGMNLAQLSLMENGKRRWDEEKAERYLSALTSLARENPTPVS